MHTTKQLPITLGSTAAFAVAAYLVENPDYAIAVRDDGLVGVTWNRSDERPNGFPHSYSHQQWFMLPRPLGQLVIAGADLFTDQQEAEQGAAPNS